MTSQEFLPSGCQAWEREVDVIVVGMGCAGASASIEAARAGAEVLALEWASGPGGSSAQSGGEIYLGGGTALQRSLGFEDDADSMYAYLEAALGPHADAEKLRVYCEGSVEHFDWLVGAGVPFGTTFHGDPCWMPYTDDGLMWLGENAWPFNEIARPAPRGHRCPAPGFAGQLLMDALVATANEVGVKTLIDTKATELVVEDGRVVGVIARQFGDTLRLRARRGVVLTTGGFVDDEQMLAQHAPRLLGHGKVSDGRDDGSGIRMGVEVGAAARRMASMQAALTVMPPMVCRGMLVNGRGQRFINEDQYPGLVSLAAIGQPSPLWVVMDEEGFEALSPIDSGGSQPQHAAETVAELETDLGLPEGSLQATIATYNQFAEQGKDPRFHKDPKWIRPLAGPFIAFAPMGGDVAAFNVFTLGGLHTDVDGRVLDLKGRPIPGLLAAGRASSGIHGEGYISGTSLGDGTFFGRRAGRAVAQDGVLPLAEGAPDHVPV